MKIVAPTEQKHGGSMMKNQGMNLKRNNGKMTEEEEKEKEEEKTTRGENQGNKKDQEMTDQEKEKNQRETRHLTRKKTPPGADRMKSKPEGIVTKVYLTRCWD